MQGLAPLSSIGPVCCIFRGMTAKVIAPVQIQNPSRITRDCSKKSWIQVPKILKNNVVVLVRYNLLQAKCILSSLESGYIAVYAYEMISWSEHLIGAH